MSDEQEIKEAEGQGQVDQPEGEIAPADVPADDQSDAPEAAPEGDNAV